MRHSFLTAGALAAAVSLLAGCGGGSEAKTAEAAPPPPVTRLADITAPSGFNFSSFQTSAGLTSRQLVANPAASGFTDAARTYVSVWYAAPDASRAQLALMSLKTLQALDASGGLRLQVPKNIAVLAFEVYDQDSTLSGEVTL